MEGGVNAQTQAIRIVIHEEQPPLLAKALHWAASLLCFALVAVLCVMAIPRFFGVHELNVTSSSMSPAYPVGTLVFAVPADPASIRPGEVVSFVMNENLDVATHRVVENNYENHQLVTQGDANANPDAPILYENVVGVVRLSLPAVGGVVDYLTNDPQGRIIGMALIGSVILLAIAAEVASSALTRRQRTSIPVVESDFVGNLK